MKGSWWKDMTSHGHVKGVYHRQVYFNRCMGQVVGQECSKAHLLIGRREGAIPVRVTNPVAKVRSDKGITHVRSDRLEVPDDKKAEIESMRENQLQDWPLPWTEDTVNTNEWRIASKDKWRSSPIKCWSCEEPDLSTDTTDSLSHRNLTCWETHSEPHKAASTTMGKSSLYAISNDFCSIDQALQNH